MHHVFRSAFAFLSIASAGYAVNAHASKPQAGVIHVTVASHARHFGGLYVRDGVSGRKLLIKEAFVIVLKDKTELRSTQMQLTPMPDPASVVDPHLMLRRMRDRVTTTNSCWAFSSTATSAHFAWCLVSRPGTEYVRELLRISSGVNDLPIFEVRMLEFADAGAKVDGSVKGSPVVDHNMFFGLEHPLSVNVVNSGIVKASLFRDLPLRATQTITYSSVLGTSGPGQMRRAFLAYLEAERPRGYEPFLHYNSWYDLGYQNSFDETGAIDRINEFGQHLAVERHVKLDSFLFDDGWDDPNSLWEFGPGFPDGFTKTGEAAARFNAGIGVWLSPWGGYAEQKQERIAYGNAHGFEVQNDGYALSGPKYFHRFQQICLDMLDRYHVNQFKFDGTGNADRVFPSSAFDSDFDAAIHLIERLRKEEPKLFVNLTTGTTASPFWVFYADSIWRGGEDHDFSGVGDSRQRWITYRDAQTYKNVAVKGPLFPLNSLMLHGVIYARQAKDLTTATGDDFAEEVHSYFGSGTQLQEMYITPALMTRANWDTLAEAARWSRAHADTLRDTHWVGGDPDKLEVYGWAAWSPKGGIVTLRNPSKTRQHFSLNLAHVFELRGNISSSYKVHSAWADTEDWPSGRTQRLQSNKSLDMDLAPFEVLTLEADSIR